MTRLQPEPHAAAGPLALLIIAAALAIISDPDPKDDTMTAGNHDDFNPLVIPDRPEPLQDAAGAADREVAAITGVITALVGYGAISTATGNLLLGLLGLLFVIFPVAASRLAAWRTAEKARAEVTPISDPAKTINGVLTRLVPDGRHARGGQ